LVDFIICQLKEYLKDSVSRPRKLNFAGHWHCFSWDIWLIWLRRNDAVWKTGEKYKKIKRSKKP